MKVREICELVRSGEITLDYAGHRIALEKEELLERFDDNVELANGSNDGKWQSIDKPHEKETRTHEEINASMRDFYNRHLDFEIEQEGTLRWGGLHDHRSCFGCGEHLHWTLTGNKLQLRNHYEKDPKHKRGYDWVNHPIDYVCPYSVPKPIVGEIKIASRLLLANFFRFDDAPEGKKYSDKYDLCTLAGRNAIAQFKSKEQNVAYGQMGNSSIGVYVNEAKDSVIIGPRYHPAEYEDYETTAEYESAVNTELFPGYTKVGEIDLQVWRWEAADLNTVGDKYEDANERDLVEIDVQHGDWTFQHNYDVIRQTENGEKDFNYIFAKLDLKK